MTICNEKRPIQFLVNAMKTFTFHHGLKMSSGNNILCHRSATKAVIKPPPLSISRINVIFDIVSLLMLINNLFSHTGEVIKHPGNKNVKPIRI